ncbi:LPS assembly lipoprotein LptE [Gammaproteobacteria bacterium]|nr:LPS assembly lipoprotein LptE [Gammaproteobacteria bacterium]
MTTRRLFIAGSAIASLSACGFRQRGSYAVPDRFTEIAVTAPIEADAYVRELKSVMKANGLQASETPTEGGSWLEVVQFEQDRSVNTVNSAGRAESYTLESTVYYRLHDPDHPPVDRSGRPLDEPPLRRVRSSRSYSFEAGQELRSRREERALSDEMLEDLAQRTLRIIAGAGNKDA